MKKVNGFLCVVMACFVFGCADNTEYTDMPEEQYEMIDDTSNTNDGIMNQDEEDLNDKDATESADTAEKNNTVTLQFYSLVDNSSISNSGITLSSEADLYEGITNDSGNIVFSDVKPGEYSISCGENYLVLDSVLAIDENDTDKRIGLIPQPENEESAYAVLVWKTDYDFDICLYNVANGDCIRNFYTSDSDGNLLLNDDDGALGVEVIEIKDITNKSYILYALDPEKFIGNKNSGLTENILGIAVYTGKGEKYFVEPGEVCDYPLWTPGYFSDGEFLVEEHSIDDTSDMVWARVDKSNPPYTKDNLVDGYYIINGDLFYSLTESVPKDFHRQDKWTFNSGYWAYYIEAENYSETLIPRISRDTVFAVKGDVDYPIIEAYDYGYAFDAVFGSFDKMGTYTGNTKNYSDVRKINGAEISPYDYYKKWSDSGKTAISLSLFQKGYGAAFKSIDYGYLLLSKEYIDDSLTVGYFDGTTYYEDSISEKIWYASSITSYAQKSLEVTETLNGYFELRIPEGVGGGLYGIYFWGRDNWKDDPYLVWID